MAEVRMTEQAATALQQVIKRKGGAAPLRIYVDHRCHCDGVKYGMALEQAVPGDTQFDVSGIGVNVTPEVSGAPGTADIDRVESLLGDGARQLATRRIVDAATSRGGACASRLLPS